ncbi:MAG: RagB/SusD family nutrient uptake outer membrane protein [Gemmatimonadetes bacterium]|nr:RagB/SusD family nutrient uptake outer membrane protein [Gemmatimonadota bacterium]
MKTTCQIRWSVALCAAVAVSACNMDLTDPNNPNESEAITTISGLKQVGVGLQATFSNGIVNPVYDDALVTDDIGAILQAFESYRNADAGLPVENSTGPSTEPWAAMYNTVQVADVLIDNVPNVALQAGTATGLLAAAKLYKAMAFGNLLNIYERIPLTVGLQNQTPSFATRSEAYAEVLKLLNQARQHITTTPPSTEFQNDVLAPGFDLANTIDAMLARYSLITGDLGGALAAAQRVNRSVLSELRFSASDPNPLWNMWYNSGNAYRMRPEDRFRTGAQPGDRRVAYWVRESTANTASNPASPLDEFTKYSVREASFPIYLPDEILLIQAEVYARQGDSTQALTLVNQVRTPCASTLNEPVACLAALTAAAVPTPQAMLDAILREREYELYLQGVHWSDLRRFGKRVKYNFMMISSAECGNNPNAPAELCLAVTAPNP